MLYTIDLSRTKKRLKKELELKGLNISLSEVAELLAKSLGFKNEHEMQQKTNKENQQKNTEENPLVFSRTDSNSAVVGLIQGIISQNPGNIIIGGTCGSGKTTLLETIKKYPGNKMLSFESTYEYLEEKDCIYNADDVLSLKKYSNRICTIHAANNIDSIPGRLHSLLPKEDFNFSNDFNIKIIIFLDNNHNIFIKTL